MIVFTYSGQGSQQPGMGAAWREHPSWELVEAVSYTHLTLPTICSV